MRRALHLAVALLALGSLLFTALQLKRLRAADRGPQAGPGSGVNLPSASRGPLLIMDTNSSRRRWLEGPADAGRARSGAVFIDWSTGKSYTLGPADRRHQRRLAVGLPLGAGAVLLVFLARRWRRG